jgi:ribonuclease J
MIEIRAVGGYSEVGKNMTVVKYKDEAVILDMGVHLENYIKFKGSDDLEQFSYNELVEAGAVPDDSIIKDLKRKVIAIIPSHGHLDHIGAIPYMASRFNAPIICTPYTASVIKAIIEDKKIKIPNEIKVLKNNKKLKISDSLSVEFVNMTHSIPDTATIVLHTPEGQVIYANDFKLDNTPVMGEKPNYERLTQLGKAGKVSVLILDSLYAHLERKTPSEAAAKEKLRVAMLENDSRGKAVIITTFSSHIARLKSIIEFGKKMNRKIVFMGRSLAKYVFAAEKIGLVNFSKDVEIVGYTEKVAKKFKKIYLEGKEKYLLVVTGHQGEPDSVLSKLASGKFAFKFSPGDQVIFSCNIIPSPLNYSNREALEAKLGENKVTMFKDIHESGHGSREDHREMINMIRPKHIIPAHAGIDKTIHLAELAQEMGYDIKKEVHLMEDGKRIEL